MWDTCKEQMCSFLRRTLWQVGSWQGTEAISLFINPCRLTPTLTAGVTPTVALAWWVVASLPQSKVTHIKSTYRRWKTQLFKHWSWSTCKMTMMTKNVDQKSLKRKTMHSLKADIKSKIPTWCIVLVQVNAVVPHCFKGNLFLQHSL